MEKNIDFSQCIVALWVEDFGPYPKHLGISNCMCNFAKASLLQIFMFCCGFNGFECFLFTLMKFLFKKNAQFIFLNNPEKSLVNVCLVKILNSTVTKKVIVCFYNLGAENFQK